MHCDRQQTHAGAWEIPIIHKKKKKNTMKAVKYWDGSCEISILGSTQHLTRHGPEQHDPIRALWVRRYWTRQPLEGPFQHQLFCDTMKLSFPDWKIWCFQMFFTLKTRCKKDLWQRSNLSRLLNVVMYLLLLLIAFQINVTPSYLYVL